MNKQLQKSGLPHVLVPIRLDAPQKSKEKIRWLHENYGFTCFCPDGLTKGHRAEHYPTREEYLEDAKAFAEVREYAKSLGLSCGWFCCLTVKSGPGFSPIVRENGTAHPFANCPLDEDFSKTLASDIAAYAAVAHPDFIFVEDDFALGAANGCFCERHLAAFEKQMGARYEREALLKIFKQDNPEALALKRAWRALKKETLVSLAEKIRAAVDILCPEIPIGLMQAGSADFDGDFTEDVARALAGKNHTPFVRLYGTFYCGFESKKLPAVMHHPLYFTQHMSEDVLRYHETDTYPHNRFYTSGKQTSALFGAAYSYGMVGSIHFAQQYFDSPFEEDAYVKAFAAEHKRLKALAALAQKCEPCGVEIGYDPFFYTQKGGASVPDFAECIGRFGIPFATKRASVACLDQTMAKYADHETLMRYLAGGLILDGDAARMLCDRGYGKYLGVSVGDDVLKARPSLQYDLGALEIISDAYLEKGEGKETWCAHAYCPRGGGKWMEIAVTDPKTKIVSEGIDFRKKPITPTMTYFENALGGKVLVLSLTIGNNPSQALYNHRRQRILQRFICKMSDEYPIVTNAPDIYLIATKAKEEGDLLGVLTLINLCEDDAEAAFIHLPKSLLSAGRFSSIQKDGSLSPLACTREEDGIRLLSPISHLVPTYIVIEK